MTLEMLTEYTGCANIWLPSGYIDSLDRAEDSCRGANQESRVGGPHPGSPSRLSRDPRRVWEGLRCFCVHWDDRGQLICVFISIFSWEACPARWPEVLRHLLPTSRLCSQVERCCGCYHIFDPSRIEIHWASVGPRNWLWRSLVIVYHLELKTLHAATYGLTHPCPVQQCWLIVWTLARKAVSQ